jgi:hypothetical protein
MMDPARLHAGDATRPTPRGGQAASRLSRLAARRP